LPPGKFRESQDKRKNTRRVNNKRSLAKPRNTRPASNSAWPRPTARRRTVFMRRRRAGFASYNGIDRGFSGVFGQRMIERHGDKNRSELLQNVRVILVQVALDCLIADEP